MLCVNPQQQEALSLSHRLSEQLAPDGCDRDVTARRTSTTQVAHFAGRETYLQEAEGDRRLLLFGPGGTGAVTPPTLP
jgi:hypothetical protein